MPQQLPLLLLVFFPARLTAVGGTAATSKRDHLCLPVLSQDPRCSSPLARTQVAPPVRCDVVCVVGNVCVLVCVQICVLVRVQVKQMSYVLCINAYAHQCSHKTCKPFFICTDNSHAYSCTHPLRHHVQLAHKLLLARGCLRQIHLHKFVA